MAFILGIFLLSACVNQFVDAVHLKGSKKYYLFSRLFFIVHLPALCLLMLCAAFFYNLEQVWMIYFALFLTVVFVYVWGNLLIEIFAKIFKGDSIRSISIKELVKFHIRLAVLTLMLFLFVLKVYYDTKALY